MNKVRYLFLAVPLVLLLLLSGPGPRLVQAQDVQVIQEVMPAVVQIYAVDEVQGELQVRWTGSGTIVSEGGLILTNCHVALPSAMWGDYPELRYDLLVIGLTMEADEPAAPTFIAQVRQLDPGLDLAVVQVTHALDGSAVDPDRLNLPYLSLGDSEAIRFGEDLTIMGYPDIGGGTITLTAGKVSGFTNERGVGKRAWIKTDATIAGGNSGGTAINEQGLLVGIPTEAGFGGADPDADQVVDCRIIVDTNGDGVRDENDFCVPGGGFINALRPVNLAKPLIQAAQQGLETQPPAPPAEAPEPAGDPAVTRLFFAPAVNENNQPVTVRQAFPSGTEELYLFFDFVNFQVGLPWQPVLRIDGAVVEDAWPADLWDGPTSGQWWLSLSGSPLHDAVYDLTIYFNNEALGTATVTVGGAESVGPTFSDIRFSYHGGSGVVLPAGINEVAAEFDYANVTADTAWSNVWYHGQREIAGGDGRALSESSGTTSLLLSSDRRLNPGPYRLDLYVGEDLAATANFLIAADLEGESLFGPIIFASAVDQANHPVDPGTTFDSGIEELYALFDHEGMRDGWRWTRRWSLNGQVVLEVDDTWRGGEEGRWMLSIYSDRGLPDGEYLLELLVEDQLVQQAPCVVGEAVIGPSATPSDVDGVEIYGQITDADTGRGIPGAIFLVLQPGVTVETFQWTEEEVYAMGEADRDGAYELSAPLIRGETYSFIVGAQAYNLIAEDGIVIPEDLDSPYRLDIALQRQ